MFSNSELSDLLQVLYLAQSYYNDSNRVPPAGMHNPTPELLEKRLLALKNLDHKIMALAQERLK